MTSESRKKIGLLPLIGLVIGSAIGAGIFGMPSELAAEASAGGAVVAWVIIGFGIMMLALCLGNLAVKRPDVDGGIFGYAEELFGEFGGFISGWGYWLSAWLGNVAFATMLMSAVGYFFPAFEGGQNIPSIILASIVMWLLTFLVMRGVENASFINLVVTICKLVPLFAFIVVALFAFNLDLFANSFSGIFSEGGVAVTNQVEGSLLAIMWVFVGIEGVTTLSSRAEKSDVSKSIVLGVAGLIVIYMLASLVGYGIKTQDELVGLANPSMAFIFREMVGPWGAAFINIGLIISILGCWLSWTMYPGETGMIMARRKLLPKSWGKINKNGAPSYSLIVTGFLVQAFMFTFLITDYAYNFAYSLCTSAILICYLLVGAYQVKYSLDNRHEKGAKLQLAIGICAVIFQVWAIYAAGLKYMLLVLTAYLPGIILYIKARKDANAQPFNGKEKIVAAVIVIGAVSAIVMLATGVISI